MDKQLITPGDPVLIENIVNYLKAQGIFDEFRHECLADVDTKSSCQNLSQRVDGYTTKFLSNETWNPDLNKNELRNKLRRQIDESGMLAVGADHVVEQVINPKIGQLFLPRIIEVVYQYLKEETEKLNSKQRIAADEKASDHSEGNSKAKTPIIDPIADILSFTYSKPKSSVSNIVQKSESVHKKSSDIALKVEKRKEDSILLSKNTELICKVEKKEEECTESTKPPEIMIKNEVKENALQVKDIDCTENLEKDIDENVGKLENNESSNENIHTVNKTQSDPKDIKIKKEIKSDESEVQLDNQKKILNDGSKLEKKKSEDVKPNEDSSLLNDTNKFHNNTKSSNQNKNKHDLVKSKKLKVNVSHKTASGDKGKTKSKDDKYLKSSSSKISKSSLKGESSKSSKKDKIDEGNVKIKTSDFQSNKLSDHSNKKSSKSSNKSSIKTEHISDKQAKIKSFKKQNTKPKKEQQLSSTNTDKGNKQLLSSSSYESSQGSDQEKSHSMIEDSSKKSKHYSKHKENITLDKNADPKHSKESPDQKRSKKDSDSNASKKHKGEKHLFSFQSKLKESKGLSHESAKISSRSNSFGSNSSISDSSNFSKEALPSSSEDVSENTNKQRESKKKASEKDYCSIPQNFPPPPPPPPPPSSDLPITESTPTSPEDNTQSSQDSESGSEGESDSDSDADSCSSNIQTSSQNSGIESDLFLYESSSSEFEGFSSPDRNKERASVSDSVSSVHTSDLSSFEDDISIGDLSDDDLPLSPDLKSKKKLPLKKAQELLDEKVHINSDDQKQTFLEEPVIEKTLPVEEKLPETILPISVPLLYEKTSPPEPRRELRRERKLNPKYASNEYTSIFTSKRTSFITKQMNLSPQKQNSSSPNASSETTLKEDCMLKNVGYRETSQEKYFVETTEVNSEPQAELDRSENFTCEKVSLMDTEPVLDEKLSLNSNKLSKNNSPNRLTLNVKNSETKANNSRKNLNSNLVKRKHEETEKTTNKRLCRRNSADSSSSKNGANENKPFNNEKLNKSVNSVSISKRNLQKPKANGDILNKIEHLRKSSHTK